MYAHIKDSSVDYMGSLPKSWDNVSGLHLSKGDNVYLKTIGWLPLVETNVTPAANQIFAPDVVTIEEDKVLLIHSARDMTAEEIVHRDESYMALLRVDRNQRLVDSDWTQAYDYPAPLIDAKKVEWATYRQSLRDLPATVDITKWSTPDWVWPTEPA